MPDASIAAKETAFQSAVAAEGFPTPVVRLSGGPADGLGRAYLVMDLVQGQPLLAGLDGIGAVRRLPRLIRQLPVALGRSMASLHDLDPTIVVERLERRNAREWARGR